MGQQGCFPSHHALRSWVQVSLNGLGLIELASLEIVKVASIETLSHEFVQVRLYDVVQVSPSGSL